MEGFYPIQALYCGRVCFRHHGVERVTLLLHKFQYCLYQQKKGHIMEDPMESYCELLCCLLELSPLGRVTGQRYKLGRLPCSPSCTSL